MDKQKTGIEVNADCEDGYTTLTMKSWSEFAGCLNLKCFQSDQFIWRGQQNPDWKLEPTIDRLLGKARGLKLTPREDHLKQFQLTSRGRRGIVFSVLQDKEENEWWALGQHNGLATPLLDWTRSPFVACHFAFAGELLGGQTYRSVYGLAMNAVVTKSLLISDQHDLKGSTDRPPIIEFFEPLADGNSRLINQSGLFTRSPDNVDVKEWVATNFKANNATILIKINIPEGERTNCLRSLNSMNINNLSLYPDLMGACLHANTKLLIPNY